MSPDDGPGRDRALDALRFLVSREAHQASAERVVVADPRRLEAGWEPRFVALGARLEEMLQLYRELGYEVVADPVRAEDVAPGCQECHVLIGLGFRMIYTRRA